jgi:hypothetical protein
MRRSRLLEHKITAMAANLSVRPRRKRAVKYLLAAAVPLILFVWISLQPFLHVWPRYRYGDILRDGKAAAGSRLFKTRDGYIMVDLGDDDEWYAYFPNETVMGYCNQPQGFSLLGLCYLAKYETLPCVVYSPVKAFEPHLERTDGYIEFDSRNGGRVRVVWRRS